MLATLAPSCFCGGDLKRAFGHPGLLGRRLCGTYKIPLKVLWHSMRVLGLRIWGFRVWCFGAKVVRFWAKLGNWNVRLSFRLKIRALWVYIGC